MTGLIVSFFDQFPSYNGQKIEIRGSDGYFNATDMSKAMGKRFRDWTRTKFAKELLESISEYSKIPVSKEIEDTPRESARGQEYLIDRGENGVSDVFLHPYVAMSYAMSDAKFQALVNIWIVNLLKTGTVNPHILQWTKEEYLRGVQYNRDDIEFMYGKKK